MQHGHWLRRWAFTALAAAALMRVDVAAAIDSCPAALAPDGTGGACPVDSASKAVGTAPGAPLPSTSVGNPIDLITGDKTQREVDLAIDGAPLGFTRYYRSATSDLNIGLGQGWRHEYAISLAALAAGGRQLTDATGRIVRFAAAAPERPGVYPGVLPSDGHVRDIARGSQWVVPDGRRVTFRGAHPVRIDWPDQRYLQLDYDRHQLVSVRDETGRTLRLEWTPGERRMQGYDRAAFVPQAAHLAAIVLPDGRRIDYAYDNLLNLTRARYADATTREYRYEHASWPHHLTTLVERTGTVFATWDYDEAGRATRSSHADGVEDVLLEIESPERVGDVGVTRITDSDGRRSDYTWRRDPRTGVGFLLSAEGAGCATCPPTNRRYAYDSSGNLLSTTTLDERGRPVIELRYAHDERGRLTRIERARTDASGVESVTLVERREYDGDSHRVTLTARPSVAHGAEHVSLTRFDAGGRPVERIERGMAPDVDLSTGRVIGHSPIERRLRLGWRDGRLHEIDGPRDDVDDVTRLEHDQLGRLITIRPPAAPAIRFEDFDAAGRPRRLRLGQRTPWEFVRDASARVVEVRQGERVMRHARDAEGRVQSVTDEHGRRIRIEHDAAGRVSGVVDDVGRRTRVERDGEGRITRRAFLAMDGSVVRSLAYLFDANGQLARSREERLDATGNARPVRTLQHDGGAIGGVVGVTDPDTGARAQVVLDLVERIASLEQADGTQLAFAYDVAGRDIALTDARGNTTRFPVDDFGRRVMLESADAGRVRYTVDGAGNRIGEQWADGTRVSYRYDAANRLLERRDADGATRWRWNEARGTLSQATTPSSAERFVHDDDARLLRHERDLGGRTFVTAYTYDAHGRLLDKTLPDGQRLRHHYHDGGPDHGRLRAITRARWYGLAAETIVGEIDQDGRDGVAGYVTTGGVRSRHAYAPNGELTELSISNAMTLQYTFDASGRIRGIDTNGVPARYGYTQGRLTSALSPQGGVLYGYDDTGNRIERHEIGNGPSRTERYRYSGTGDRLLAVSPASGESELVHAYDAAGSPLMAGELTYVHDAARRPVEVRRRGSLIATYTYNAFGERISKTVHAGSDEPSITTWFLYDGHTLNTEIDGDGKVAAQYVHLPDGRPVAKLQGEAVHGIHGDHLGTPRVMVDGDGRTVWRANYTPFGQATMVIDEVALPLRLPGQYADAETGTHYNRFRDYDPRTGRYLTADPVDLLGGTNRYGYVGGDPLSRSDPSGLWWTFSSLSEAELRSMDGNPDEIFKFVNDELESFDDRQVFYSWAHEQLNNKPGATQTDWFQGASDVNDEFALGIADLPAWLTPLQGPTVDFLDHAGRHLAIQNVQTFIDLYFGRSPLGQQCLVGDELDLALVGYEQRALSAIIDDYFGQPGVAAQRDGVFADINSIMNGSSEFDRVAGSAGDANTRLIIDTLFPDGFDLESESDRVKLGEALMRINEGRDWKDPELYD